jgi:C4-dicarboxylate transporter DctM subunit
MEWGGLIAVVACLVLLRQNLLVMLGVVLGYTQLVFGDGRLTDIVVDVWDAANKDVLLSIPLYLLAGNIMSRGVMAKRLIRLMQALASPVPGGLAMAAVASCALFAAVSGSGTVTLLAIGSVMYPALVAAGYPRSYALGALCSAGTLGIIIPPSIPLILYGVMTQTSIAKLFLAGIGPGLLLTLLLMVHALLRNRGIRSAPWSGAEIAAAFRGAAWTLLMPLIVLGGIYGGIFTATESAAVAVAYALAVEMLAYRELGLRDLHAVVGSTTALLGSLFPVLMLALSLNTFLVYEQVPDLVVEELGRHFDSPLGFLVAVNLLLLLVGCIMDVGSAILILAPVLAPVAAAQGIDPVHFGIIMVMNLEIGYMTPPVGMNLIVATAAYGVDFRSACRAVMPFIVLLLGGLAMVAAWPELALFLVR